MEPAQSPAEDHQIHCSDCAEWNQPQAPLKLHGHSYYVGVRGLSAVLIQTTAGLILLDGGLPQSAPLISDRQERLSHLRGKGEPRPRHEAGDGASSGPQMEQASSACGHMPEMLSESGQSIG